MFYDYNIVALTNQNYLFKSKRILQIICLQTSTAQHTSSSRYQNRKRKKVMSQQPQLEEDLMRREGESRFTPILNIHNDISQQKQQNLPKQDKLVVKEEHEAASMVLPSTNFSMPPITGHHTPTNNSILVSPQSFKRPSQQQPKFVPKLHGTDPQQFEDFVRQLQDAVNHKNVNNVNNAKVLINKMNMTTNQSLKQQPVQQKFRYNRKHDSRTNSSIMSATVVDLDHSSNPFVTAMVGSLAKTSQVLKKQQSTMNTTKTKSTSVSKHKKKKSQLNMMATAGDDHRVEEENWSDHSLHQKHSSKRNLKKLSQKRSKERPLVMPQVQQAVQRKKIKKEKESRNNLQNENGDTVTNMDSSAQQNFYQTLKSNNNNNSYHKSGVDGFSVDSKKQQLFLRKNQKSKTEREITTNQRLDQSRKDLRLPKAASLVSPKQHHHQQNQHYKSYIVMGDADELDERTSKVRKLLATNPSTPLDKKQLKKYQRFNLRRSSQPLATECVEDISPQFKLQQGHNHLNFSILQQTNNESFLKHIGDAKVSTFTAFSAAAELSINKKKKRDSEAHGSQKKQPRHIFTKDTESSLQQQTKTMTSGRSALEKIHPTTNSTMQVAMGQQDSHRNKNQQVAASHMMAETGSNGLILNSQNQNNSHTPFMPQIVKTRLNQGNGGILSPLKVAKNSVVIQPLYDDDSNLNSNIKSRSSSNRYLNSSKKQQRVKQQTNLVQRENSGPSPMMKNHDEARTGGVSEMSHLDKILNAGSDQQQYQSYRISQNKASDHLDGLYNTTNTNTATSLSKKQKPQKRSIKSISEMQRHGGANFHKTSDQVAWKNMNTQSRVESCNSSLDRGRSTANEATQKQQQKIVMMKGQNNGYDNNLNHNCCGEDDQQQFMATSDGFHNHQKQLIVNALDVNLQMAYLSNRPKSPGSNEDLTYKGSIKQLKEAMRIKPDFIKPISIMNRHRKNSVNLSPQKPTMSRVNSHDHNMPQSTQTESQLSQHQQYQKQQLLQQQVLPQEIFKQPSTITTFSNKSQLPQYQHQKSQQQQNGLQTNIQEFQRLTVAVQSLTSSRKLNQQFNQQKPKPIDVTADHHFVHLAGSPTSIVRAGLAAGKKDLNLSPSGGQYDLQLSPNAQKEGGLAEVIKRQLIATQANNHQDNDTNNSVTYKEARRQRAASLILKQQQDLLQRDSKIIQNPNQAQKHKKESKKNKEVEIISAGQEHTLDVSTNSRMTSTMMAMFPSNNTEILDNKGFRSPQIRSPSTSHTKEFYFQESQGNLNTNANPKKLSKRSKKEKKQLAQTMPQSKKKIISAQETQSTGPVEPTKQPQYPKYQVKEEQKASSGQVQASNKASSQNYPSNKQSSKTTKDNQSSSLPPQKANAQKYEQLMAQSFIPELSILENRITELSKMPAQLQQFIQRTKTQQENGIMSILKPADESNRLLLKQKAGKDGTKMLITARNDSLSRFTKELKQHQIPANKKVTLNLSPQRRAGALTMPVAINSPAYNTSSGHGKDSTRKKVNFDLPGNETILEPPKRVVVAGGSLGGVKINTVAGQSTEKF